MSKKNDILTALASRLGTITVANGYSLNVVHVFGDVIPMGLSLETHELPAILLIPRVDKIDPKGQNKIYCEWIVHLQLIHGYVSNSIMFNFVRDVAKAIFANHPTADRQDEYRTIHPSIYKMDITFIDPDLNMIEANRFEIMELNIKFITQYNDL